ncbi:MAG: ubiquinone biosynthesis regulatory protein kinase UbiB [Thioalkalivibrionaceae bacterium]
MRFIAQFGRLWFISRILVRHRLDNLLFELKPLRPLRFLLLAAPWNWFRGPTIAPRGERLRRTLEDLGPIFVKFGQMLSTRRDLLPDDIAAELAKLQDRVPPFPGEEAIAVIESELEQPIAALFDEFDSVPLASASIAQVHTARLKTGEAVIVKVVRPGIERTIRADLEVMRLLAALADRYSREARRLRPREVVAEYEKTVIDELDLLREAANAVAIRRHFEDSDLLYIPQVYFDLTRTRVMVQERIYGIPISNIARLTALGIDLKALAERGVEIFFTQVFTHNFFHADMHPGNIFVDPTRPHNPRYLAVDFGIVGSLLESDQHYLAENFYAFFHRDYRRVAELHVESGWVPAGTRVDEFESAIRTVCEPIFEKPLDEISFGQVLLRLFQTARRFDMQVQPQLVLLQKTLLNIEGLGRELYPSLDLWATAKPFIERWMSEQVGPRAFIRSAQRHLPRFLAELPEWPARIERLLERDESRNDELIGLRAAVDRLEILERLRLEQARRTRIGTLALVVIIVTIGIDLWHEPFSMRVLDLPAIALPSALVLIWAYWPRRI